MPREQYRMKSGLFLRIFVGCRGWWIHAGCIAASIALEYLMLLVLGINTTWHSLILYFDRFVFIISLIILLNGQNILDFIKCILFFIEYIAVCCMIATSLRRIFGNSLWNNLIVCIFYFLYVDLTIWFAFFYSVLWIDGYGTRRFFLHITKDTTQENPCYDLLFIMFKTKNDSHGTIQVHTPHLCSTLSKTESQ